MSGVEILGIISGAITLIDATGKLYRAIKDTSEIPKSLRDIAGRLPLIQDTLQQLWATVAEDNKQLDEYAFVNAVEACSAKASELNKIFESVILEKGASPADRGRRVVNTLTQSDQAQHLFDGIMVDLHLLTGNRLLRAQGAIPTSATRESKKNTNEYVTFSNSGSGSQFNQTKSGHQIMNFGTGPQINSEISGSLYFTTSR